MLESVEKGGRSYTVGGNINWYSNYGEQYRGFLKTKNRTTINNPAVLLLGHLSGENHNSKRYMHLSVHCSAIYNSQDMDATSVSIVDERIKKMCYTYTTEHYSAIKMK